MTRRTLLRPLVLLALILGACSSPTPVPPPGGAGVNTTRGLTIRSTTAAELSVTPNSQQPLTFTVTAAGTAGGEVTVTLADLPPGVTASTAQVQLSAGATASGTLTVTGGASLRPGSYTAALTASGGGAQATVALPLVIPQGTVVIALPGYGQGTVTLAQGSSARLPVSLDSVGGFSGETALRVVGLPAGVTAAPLTVQVQPGRTTTAALTLTASEDAALTETTLQVTSPEHSAAGGGDTSNRTGLRVVPAQTPVGALTSGLTRAPQGVWRLNEAPPNSGQPQVLERYEGRVPVQRVPLPGDAYWSVLRPTPAGDLYLFTVYSAQAGALRVTAGGAVSRLSVPAQAYQGAADLRGDFWFIQPGSGGGPASLARWTPGGATVMIDRGPQYGSGTTQTTQVALNVAGTTGYVFGSGGVVTRFDPASGAAVPSTLAATLASAAVSDSGSLYYSDARSNLGRLDLDGTVTPITLPNVYSTVVGFDRADPERLWLASSDQVAHYSVSSGRLAATPVPDQSAYGTVTASVAGGGGLNYVTRSGYSASGDPGETISFLR